MSTRSLGQQYKQAIHNKYSHSLWINVYMQTIPDKQARISNPTKRTITLIQTATISRILLTYMIVSSLGQAVMCSQKYGNDNDINKDTVYAHSKQRYTGGIVPQFYIQIVKEKAISVPVQILNGVPYLQLQALCDAQPQVLYTTYLKQKQLGYQPIHQNTNNLYDVFHKYLEEPVNSQSEYLEEPTTYHEQKDIKVLLDLGSTQLWLADSSCSGCQYKRTKSLCPHLSQSQVRVNYVKGYIQGIHSYINLCHNRVKFLCVKQINNIGLIVADGIFGLRYDSPAYNILTNIIRFSRQQSIKLDNKSKQLKVNAVNKHKQVDKKNIELWSRYELSFNFNLLINNFTLKYKKIVRYKSTQPIIYNQGTYGIEHEVEQKQQKIMIRIGSNWQFDIEYISLFSGKIIISKNGMYQNQTMIKEGAPQKAQTANILGYVDTGSTKIVISQNMCKYLISQIHNKFKFMCRYVEHYGIDCSQMVSSIQFKLAVNTMPQQHQTQGKKVLIQIYDTFLIDNRSNRINILCEQPAQQETQQRIILGYPFLQSHLTTLIVEQKQTEKQEQEASNKYLQIQVYPPGSFAQQSNIVKIIMVLYLCSILMLSWAILTVLDYIRDKTDKKIII